MKNMGFIQLEFVSILVLMDSRVKTYSMLAIGMMAEIVSILVLMDSRVKTINP